MAKQYARVLQTNANMAPVFEGEIIELIDKRSEDSWTFYKRHDYQFHKAYEVQWGINTKYIEIFTPTDLEKVIYDIEV